MKLCVTASLLVIGIGCATRDPGAIQTRIVTFPDGALVEYNGKPIGRAPAKITLPQNAEGRLTEKAEIRVLPNSDQTTLYPQIRNFDPSSRTERVPNQILVDMRAGGTNQVALASGQATHVETETKRSTRPPVPYTERSKPTQAVGLDRWKAGIY